jgi:hypothetical protein
MIRAGYIGRSSGGSGKLPFHEVHEETGNGRTIDILATRDPKVVRVVFRVFFYFIITVFNAGE